MPAVPRVLRTQGPGSLALGPSQPAKPPASPPATVSQPASQASQPAIPPPSQPTSQPPGSFQGSVPGVHSGAPTLLLIHKFGQIRQVYEDDFAKFLETILAEVGKNPARQLA